MQDGEIKLSIRIKVDKNFKSDSE